jgi:hypothetical protein
MKKMITTFAVAAGLLGAAGGAQALDINMYGSSALFEFLGAVSNDLLTASGCTTIAGLHTSTDGTESMTYGTNGTAGTICANSDTGIGGPTTNLTGGINYRVANKSSRDGIKAVNGTGAGAGCSATGNGYAKFILDYGAPNVTSCQLVTLGTSDVLASTFNETNQGCEYGPVLNKASDGNYYCASPDIVNKACTYNFDGNSAGGPTSASQYPAECWRNVQADDATSTPNGASAIGLNAGVTNVASPIVVPFAFYVNNSVQVSQCTSGPVTGSLCSTANGTSPNNADCQGGTCASGPLSNISRIMATQIFSGAVTKWTDFGTAYSSTAPHLFIRACLRSAGSGTLATLNREVMFGTTWGKALALYDGLGTCKPGAGAWPGCLKKADNLDDPTGANAFWFNSSTDDMLHCINSLDNAIGVADADACLSTSSYRTGGSSYAAYTPNYTLGAYSASYPMTDLCSNIHQLTYDGSWATRDNIRNGNYDYWTIEQIYMNTTTYGAGSPQQTFVTNLQNEVNNPANITVAKVGGSAYYWATPAEMRYAKSTPDISYPTKVLPAPSGSDSLNP